MKSTKYNFLIVLALLFATTISYSQENKNVGIGTDNPQTTLDIRGDLKLTPDSYESGSSSQLYWLDNNNNVEAGNHEILKKSSLNDKSEKYFYSFNIVIPINEWRPDVYDFNTHIPAKDYNLNIINSNLLQNLDDSPVALSHVDSNLSGSRNITGNPIKQVDCWVADDGNWHVSATYKSAWYITADNKVGAKWVISMLAIDTNYGVRVDPNPNYDTGRNETKYERHYKNIDENNPQNASTSEPRSWRGDSFKLKPDMTGGAKVDPLIKYENN